MSFSANSEAVDQYIQAAPAAQASRLSILRSLIKEEVPEALEGLSYKMPAYKLKGKVLVYFSTFENHIGVYPRTALVESGLGDQLSAHASGKGSLHFRHDQEFPTELIRSVVKTRCAEVLAKTKKAAKKI